jgi:DNA-nicking Smr family endonuclease
MGKRPGNDDDARAFEEAMSGARPLPGGPRRVVGPQRRKAPAPRQPAPVRAARPDATEPPSGQAGSGRAPDVSTRELRALRSGDRRTEARLDLHGMTRDEALDAAERFVQRCRAGGLRAVLIIHGRGLNSDGGDPVLRPAVLAWLAGAGATRAGVMAFAPAPARAGGTGATVVLLRR